jgi:hypothetical protein
MNVPSYTVVDGLPTDGRRYVRGTRWRQGNSDTLADEYGVSAQTIRDAVARRTWRHVA